ncbi:MAG: CRISPR-associated protein Cas5 [Desulfurococcus sp.]|uniref:CRISPR-associated protein Cas5 n=1 Tax=Desulfurococcus sp. TaxID=51678 RepID=UPI003166E797
MVEPQDIRVFYARASFSWGFTVRYKGVSAAQPSYPIPPPTTVVGAFGYPLARLLGLNPHGKEVEKHGEGLLISPPMKAFLESTITASVALVRTKGSAGGISVYLEPSRIIGLVYKTGGQVERVKKAKMCTREFHTEALGVMLPVQALGSAYAPGLVLDLLWIIDAGKLVKELGVSRESFEKAASKAVYGVVRIGSKEGLVALHTATYLTSVKILNAGEKFKTRFYVDARCVEPLDREYVLEIELPGIRYDTSKFYIAAQTGSQNLIIPLSESSSPPWYRVLTNCKGFVAPISEEIVGVAPVE